jgi:hypothetical protein
VGRSYSAFLCEDLGFSSAVSSASVKSNRRGNTEDSAEDAEKNRKRRQAARTIGAFTKSETLWSACSKLRTPRRTVASGILLLAGFENDTHRRQQGKDHKEPGAVNQKHTDEHQIECQIDWIA